MGCRVKIRTNTTHITFTHDLLCSDTSTTLDSDDEKLLDTIAPGTPDMATMKGYTEHERQVLHSFRSTPPESSMARTDRPRDNESRRTRAHKSHQVGGASPVAGSGEDSGDGVPKFMRDYSTQEAHNNFNLNDFYNLLEVCVINMRMYEDISRCAMLTTQLFLRAANSVVCVSTRNCEQSALTSSVASGYFSLGGQTRLILLLGVSWP